MTPEAQAPIDRAHLELEDARRAATYDLDRLAARAAYYAAFRAAEAFIVERSGKVAKTHRGVRSEFARLWRETPAADSSLVAVLTRGYVFKETADHGTGPADAITHRAAIVMIEDATRFVARVTDLLASSPSAERG